MASVLGYFDAFTATTASNLVVNSPMAINGIISQLATFVNFIILAVIGATVYRDYKYNSHTLLFAYPFNKFQYLTGKFLSGFFVTILITLSIGLAFLVASVLPFANQDLLGPVKLGAYFQSYLLFVVPNIFFRSEEHTSELQSRPHL